jgi:nitrogen regulatory protein PII
MNEDRDFDLIITIVNRGNAIEVVEASRKAGAEGATVVNGRGSGIHENAKIFGIIIEPEKEMILIIIEKKNTEKVLNSIREAVKLDETGNGIAFVLEVEKTVGLI